MEHINSEIHNPGPLKVPNALKGFLIALIALGVVIFIVELQVDPTRAWTSFLLGHFYFMGLAILSVFFIAINWIVSSMWSTPARRVAEALSSYLPVVLGSLIVLFFGAKTLYKWSNPSFMMTDPILEGKASYLNMNFFVVRSLIVCGVWVLLRRVFVKASLSLDDGADYLSVWAKCRKFGAIFLIIFAVSWTMMCIDQLKSLDPYWFSTMFGVYLFGAFFQSFFAVAIVVGLWMKWSGRIPKEFFKEEHLHDLATFMFAFTVFWAYTGFSQYMLTWYANLPEETGYFMLRFNNAWYNHSIALFLVKFVIPFFALLPRANKRNEGLAFTAAIWILGAQFYELIWIIQPEFYPNGPHIGIAEIGLWLGFGGAFALSFVTFLGKHAMVPYKDARLSEAVHYHT